MDGVAVKEMPWPVCTRRVTVWTGLITWPAPLAPDCLKQGFSSGSVAAPGGLRGSYSIQTAAMRDTER
jgi:hypothetical protein